MSPHSQAYYRQGVALQCLARHAEALGAFSTGLSMEPKSTQLLAGLIEAAMKSPLRGKDRSEEGECMNGQNDGLYVA